MSGYSPGQTWGALRKAWKGYRIAKVQKDQARMKEYADKIRTLQGGASYTPLRTTSLRRNAITALRGSAWKWPDAFQIPAKGKQVHPSLPGVHRQAHARAADEALEEGQAGESVGGPKNGQFIDQDDCHLLDGNGAAGTRRLPSSFLRREPASRGRRSSPKDHLTTKDRPYPRSPRPCASCLPGSCCRHPWS